MTSLSGGRSMFGFSPIKRDGSGRQYDNTNLDIIGVHTGDFAGLNVVNPIPGKHYQYAKSDPTSQMRERAKGGVAVHVGDEDSPAWRHGLVEDESDTPTLLDTALPHGDVLLMRYDESRISAQREQEAEASLRNIRDADSGYLNGASPAEIATGRGKRTRFAERMHFLQVQGESGEVLEQWNPENGILKS